MRKQVLIAGSMVACAALAAVANPLPRVLVDAPSAGRLVCDECGRVQHQMG